MKRRTSRLRRMIDNFIIQLLFLRLQTIFYFYREPSRKMVFIVEASVLLRSK